MPKSYLINMQLALDKDYCDWEFIQSYSELQQRTFIEKHYL